jgi:hypothetical protein
MEAFTLNRKQWQEYHNLTDEEMLKIQVFVPPGKIISIKDCVDIPKNDSILVSKEVKDK